MDNQYYNKLGGHEFEYFCADILAKNGYTDIIVTPGSGDQGVDIIAKKDGIKFAIQCKNYSSPLGNTPVQEVVAGRLYYQCNVGVVLTNSTFTDGAIELANATGIVLWDGEKLKELIKNANDLGYNIPENLNISTESKSNTEFNEVHEWDEYLFEAINFILVAEKASIGMLQRKFKIGFNRAALIMDQIAELGIVGPEDGTKPRKILISYEEWERITNNLSKGE